ncbi:MAG TPA: hypothetical protein PLV76_04410 [Spirochaetales bacterium]|nr:hypothetical protein [Spirochaetales bacterium]
MSAEFDFANCQGTLPRSDGVLNLSPAEAYKFLSQGAILVDLRESYETNYRVFDVDEVLYLPWTRFASSYHVLPHDRPLILADAAGIYCREAAAMLRKAGYTNIAKLSGGMIDWDASGLPVRKDPDYALGGQCACKIKTRTGENPLMTKHAQPERNTKMISVLFLCVHNSARSQMAEAFLKKHGGNRFTAESAGLELGKLNPYVVRAMAEVGIDISGNATKSVFDLHAAGKTYDVVVTVCSKEAAERCPIFPGLAERHHWPFNDPSAFAGSDAEIMEQVRLVRDEIEQAVIQFVREHAS